MTKKTFFIIILIVVLGLFMRGFQFRDRFSYGHDSDLASWIVKDIVVNHHVRLIGQLTSAPGIFIGGLFYYLLIPFYLLAGMDPIGGIFLSWSIAVISIVSVFYVFYNLYNSRTGLIGSFIYALSYGLSSTERLVVPTTPVTLWTVWFYYGINLLFQGKKQGLLIMGVLFALVWHLSMALGLLAPLVLLAIVLNISKFKFKDFVLPALLFLVLSLPLVIFEYRHGFSQTKSALAMFTSKKVTPKPQTFIQKLGHIVLYANRNANRNIATNLDEKINPFIVPGTFLLTVLILTLKKRLPSYTPMLFGVWIFLYFVFFYFQPLNLSEYYLDGLNVLWIAASALFINFLISSPNLKLSGYAILAVYCFVNVRALLDVNINHNGYIEKKALVSFISSDARIHGYPCVSVSYITNPGYNLGYRYFFWLAKLHVNQPSSSSPVYSIVFPHSLVDKIDKSFGALGLIYPDYKRYNQNDVNLSCSGPDANITDPMFGFTK